MIRRKAYREVVAALDRAPAVALLGPRQVGKTTLALEVGATRNATYLDLQKESDRRKLEDPELFLASRSLELIILDEVHRVPNLFPVLRGLIDEGRRRRVRSGRFLLLGSASLDLLSQAGESLAGRITFVDLTPFGVGEVAEDRDRREMLFLRGGFPESFLATDDENSFEWRSDFLRTYLERDVAEFVPRLAGTTLRRFWTMLAHRQGAPLNAADLARSIDASHVTVSRYLDLLGHLLLVRRLEPFVPNVGKRLTKSPKVYIRDSGLVHALLGIRTSDELAGHPVIGASWEGFVVESLMNVLPASSTAGYYRTLAGAEVDLVLELPGPECWAVEVKRSLAPRPTQGFWTGLEDVRAQRGFVVYAGDDRYPLRDRVEAIGVNEMVALLEARSARR